MAFLGRVDALPQLLIKLALTQVVCIQDEAHFLKAYFEELREVAAANEPVAVHTSV